jgi:hypothetical protein
LNPAWLAGLAGLLAALGVLWWGRLRRSATGSPTSDLYWRIRAALARTGIDAPPSTTPDEFLAACAPALDTRPALRAAVAQATRLYVQVAYSPHPTRPSETFAADQMWREARSEWLELWLGAVWRQFHRPSHSRKGSRSGGVFGQWR